MLDNWTRKYKRDAKVKAQPQQIEDDDNDPSIPSDDEDKGMIDWIQKAAEKASPMKPSIDA